MILPLGQTCQTLRPRLLRRRSRVWNGQRFKEELTSIEQVKSSGILTIMDIWITCQDPVPEKTLGNRC